MQFLYKIPGYILVCFGGFCLSWGGFIIRSFEQASIWQILFLRSFFFLLGFYFTHTMELFSPKTNYMVWSYLVGCWYYAIFVKYWILEFMTYLEVMIGELRYVFNYFICKLQRFGISL